MKQKQTREWVEKQKRHISFWATYYFAALSQAEVIQGKNQKDTIRIIARYTDLWKALLKTQWHINDYRRQHKGENPPANVWFIRDYDIKNALEKLNIELTQEQKDLPAWKLVEDLIEMCLQLALDIEEPVEQQETMDRGIENHES